MLTLKQRFTVAHFDRWLELFHDTVDSGWAGVNAERAKALARKVADVHARQIVGEAPSAAAGPGPVPLSLTPRSSGSARPRSTTTRRSA